MTQSTFTSGQSPPGSVATYFWLVLSLLCSMIFLLLLAPNPSPLADRLHRLNFHVLHIPWSTFLTSLLVVVLLMPCLALLGAAVGFWRSRRMRVKYVPRLLIAASVAMTIVAGFEALPVLDGGYTWVFRERFDSLSAEREMCQVAESYADVHVGHWPPHLAALVTLGLSPRAMRYRYSKTPVLSDAVFASDPGQWSTIAAEVDAHCDFAYLGGDLTASPALRAESARIVILYGKIDLPEIPQVIYDADHHVYEYPFAARPIAFADGHARFVPLEELAQVFADHNAARARVGLPAQLMKP
jgi:hypothetical protein